MIVKLPDHDLSKAAAARSKHWIKRLTGVDQSQDTGYAFLGQFESFNATVAAEPGTWFLSYVEYRRGSGRLEHRDVELLRVVGGNLDVIEAWRLDSNAGWALKVRDRVAQLMTDADADTDETILVPLPVIEKLAAVRGRLDVLAGRLVGFEQQEVRELSTILKNLVGG